MTHKFSRMQNLRIALLCGADLRSIAKYESGDRRLKPITQYGIRAAIKALGYIDPRPATADESAEMSL